MGRPRSRKPTDAELDVLHLLWTHGALGVRDIYLTLKHSRRVGYTTILKQVQIMTTKGLTKKDTSRRPQLYTAGVRRADVERQVMQDLLNRMFEGDADRFAELAQKVGQLSEADSEPVAR